MITSVTELPDDVETLKRVVAEKAGLLDQHEQTIAQYEAAIAQHEARIRELEHQVRVLTKIAFAPKSERRPSPGFELHPGQMHLLFPEIIEAAERVADEKKVEGNVEIRTMGHARVPRRRKHFPPHLPVIRTSFELPAEQRACTCGATMEPIGEELSRELERLEIAVVHEIARAKYACKACEAGVKIAPGPDRVIDKGILGTGFLAHVLIERFAHHMPYNRLEAKYASEGFDLSRSVLCESSVRCAELLAPIAEQIRKDAIASGFVQTDDTPVTIQEDSHQRSRQGRVWVYRGNGGKVFFDSTESRSRDGPAEVLAGFRGYLQADAFPGYDALYRSGEVLEVGCWAHARRYFIDAECTEPELAKDAIARIGELYGIERRAKEAGLSSEQIRELRQREALPILARLRDWLSVTRTKVLDKGPLAKAIDYTLSNWTALCRYCEDGRLATDNNAAERALRTVAVGRKNWIFFGNERGGQAAAVIYSLIATCKEHGVDLRTYLWDVLQRIAKTSDVRELTPYGWKETWAKVVQDHRASIIERLLVASQA
jgi:transposase